MNYIIEFYNGLDTVNLIIFWGVILVILLLLIFSIIIVNRNKKLEKIIEAKGIDIDEENIDDLAIKKIDESHIENKNKNENIEEKIITEERIPIITDEIAIPIIDDKLPTKEEKFVAEEHVMEYNKDFFEIPNIKKQNEIKENNDKTDILIKNSDEKINEVKKEINSTIPRIGGAYQKNILREVYPNQTSPIGSVKKEILTLTESKKEEESNESLNAEKHTNTETMDNRIISQSNEVKHEIRINEVNKNNNRIPIYPEVQRKGNYLEELSKKMSQNNSETTIDRTSYELQQEQEAIISYKELMEKKDNIKMVDEEDAIISIEELNKRKREAEKLYNITEKEPNDDFIKELKNFRSDL